MKTIRFAQLSDAPALLSIYAYYVENSVITFEYEAPPLVEFEARMIPIQQEYPSPVCEIDQKIVGYAYAHRHMERAAYQWNVELSVYLQPQAQHRQIGKALYTALLEILPSITTTESPLDSRKARRRVMLAPESLWTRNWVQ